MWTCFFFFFGFRNILWKLSLELCVENPRRFQQFLKYSMARLKSLEECSLLDAKHTSIPEPNYRSKQPFTTLVNNPLLFTVPLYLLPNTSIEFRNQWKQSYIKNISVFCLLAVILWLSGRCEAAVGSGGGQILQSLQGVFRERHTIKVWRNAWEMALRVTEAASPTIRRQPLKKKMQNEKVDLIRHAITCVSINQGQSWGRCYVKIFIYNFKHFIDHSMQNSHDKSCTEAGITNLLIVFTKGIIESKIKAFTCIIPQWEQCKKTFTDNVTLSCSCQQRI